MKDRCWYFPFTLLSCIFLLTISCKKDNDPENILKDIDGNVYQTITIGTQVWMVENLKTTKYRNGDPIPNITSASDWGNLTSGAVCDYNNNLAISTNYSKLYNWYAVNDSRNIAPAGWHIPTDEEWTVLATCLGGENIAGGKLKEIGTVHWNSPNTGATNESGFTALASGCHNSNGTFKNIDEIGNWWSATEFSAKNAWYRSMNSANSNASKGINSKCNGYSVRCLKD